MGMLNKEAYERKREYAVRRMKKNAEVKTLTEDQHDALSWLCSIRHEVHCNQSAFFYAESADSETFWNYIDDGSGTGEIAERLADADLPPLVWSFDPQDYTFDSVCYELDYTDEEIKEEAERCLEMAEKFNDDIESYLAKIDKKHGTDYCPSGWTRLC